MPAYPHREIAARDEVGDCEPIGEEQEGGSFTFKSDTWDLNLFVGPGLEPVFFNSFGGPVAFEIHMLKVLRDDE